MATKSTARVQSRVKPIGVFVDCSLITSHAIPSQVRLLWGGAVPITPFKHAGSALNNINTKMDLVEIT